jgi:hypothetical protein
MILSQRARDTAALIFAVTGGAWAWTLQLWLSWIVGEPACFLAGDELRVVGVGSQALWVLIGVATGALALAALIASYRIWRAAGGQELGEEPSGGGPRRFLVYVGLVLNALFLLTIIMGVTSPLFLAPCI